MSEDRRNEAPGAQMNIISPLSKGVQCIPEAQDPQSRKVGTPGNDASDERLHNGRGGKT